PQYFLVLHSVIARTLRKRGAFSRSSLDIVITLLTLAIFVHPMLFARCGRGMVDRMTAIVL
ncbi:MAG: hypothetical protein AAB869_01925, partial [Patescibacteria group bacterium]